MKKYKIYVLIDPICFDIKYVGVTSMSLEKRLIAHLSAKDNGEKLLWIRNLKLKGKIPIIKEREVVSKNKYFGEREKYWINYYLNKKYYLFNQNNL